MHRFLEARFEEPSFEGANFSILIDSVLAPKPHFARQARVGFEADWSDLLPGIPAGAFEEWRHQRDFTEEKYASWARGERQPSKIPTSMMRCVCGVQFDSWKPAESYDHRRHIYAASADR
jgi:hypothetical protein